jgi:hypothetical protein
VLVVESSTGWLQLVEKEWEDESTGWLQLVLVVESSTGWLQLVVVVVESSVVEVEVDEVVQVPWPPWPPCPSSPSQEVVVGPTEMLVELPEPCPPCPPWPSSSPLPLLVVVAATLVGVVVVQSAHVVLVGSSVGQVNHSVMGQTVTVRVLVTITISSAAWDFQASEPSGSRAAV